MLTVITMRIWLCVFSLFLMTSTAFSMDVGDIKPHQPTKSPWSEQWFYYLNDPEVGYYKVSFQTYLEGHSPALTEKAYLHLAFAPKNGAVKTYDLYYDDVYLVADEDPNSESFQYIIPGVIEADEQQVSVTLDEFNFSMRWIGEHKHYWDRFFNPGEGPFGLISSLPFIDNRWFVYSMGTPAEYQFTDGEVTHQGMGTVSIDKGWYTIANSDSFIYVFAADEKTQFMFTGAEINFFPIEMWAGRYLSENQDLVFYPGIKGLSVAHVADACRGTFHLEMNKLFYKVVVEAKAPLDSFYDSTMPTVHLLGAQQPIMKSMYSEINVKIYKFGKLIEEKDIAQGFLEFGDSQYCSERLN